MKLFSKNNPVHHTVNKLTGGGKKSGSGRKKN